MNYETLQNKKIKTIKEGLALIDELEEDSRTLLSRMREQIDKDEWKLLEDMRYENKKAIHALQSQITKIFKAQRSLR